LISFFYEIQSAFDENGVDTVISLACREVADKASVLALIFNDIGSSLQLMTYYSTLGLWKPTIFLFIHFPGTGGKIKITDSMKT
jgi:hypothetical protein